MIAVLINFSNLLITALILPVCATVIHVLEWKLAPRAGTNTKGEQNTQIELTESTVLLNTVLERFHVQLKACQKHHNEMEWL